MNVLDIPLTILRFQYKLVRIPLGLFEANVVNSLGTEAPARLVYERTVGTLDKKVGCMLGDDEAVQQGDAQIHHVNEIARAKKLEAEADAKEAEAKQRRRTNARPPSTPPRNRPSRPARTPSSVSRRPRKRLTRRPKPRRSRPTRSLPHAQRTPGTRKKYRRSRSTSRPRLPQRPPRPN